MFDPPEVFAIRQIAPVISIEIRWKVAAVCASIRVVCLLRLRLLQKHAHSGKL